jgi:DNA polymerase-3 subunit alpha
MSFIPQHIHTSFSLLDGIIKPEKLAKRCKELGYTHCCITDHGSVSGFIKFANAMKKENITPIFGTEFYVSYNDSTIKDAENRKMYHMVACAKNKQSWDKLVKAISESNKLDNFYYKPRLDIEKLASIIGDSCFIFSGHPGSYLWDFKTLPEIITGINYLKGLFGDNLCLELQRFIQDPEVNSHINLLIQAGKETNTPAKACIDAHYTNKEDSELHRIVLCSNLHKTLPQINKMKSEDKPMGVFFEKDYFFVPSIEELKSYGHTEEELDLSFISSKIEKFDLQEQPRLPKFIDNEDELLKQMCRDGWKRKSKVNWGKKYLNRVKMELDILIGAKLSGYFLIVADYINWAKENGMLLSPGRGSSAGSLVCYLLNITEVDPILYNLDFSRFYNESRNTPGNISLPDIDTDFPANKREEVIEYLRNKYGKDKVCQIATFGTLKGKASLKEVFRVCEVCDFETMNKITKPMPNEADISDELEEQGEDSIISWCLRNQPKMFQEYCYLEDDVLKGDYAKYFKIAIELEGIHKSQGKHAAGVIVSREPLADIAPLIYDKSGEAIVALDKKDAEKIGLVKFDILGLSCLDKLMSINNLLRTGKL